MENTLVKDAGYAIEALRVEGISRRISLTNLRALYRAGKAVGQAKRLSHEFSPDIVQKSQHIGFFRIHTCCLRNPFGTKSSHTAVISPWTGIAFFRLTPQLLCFRNGRIGPHHFSASSASAFWVLYSWE